jgi:ribosomal protein L37AE/L43A
MKCPRCGNYTLVVFKINDGLWGCPVCRDGKNKTTVETIASALDLLVSFNADEDTEQPLQPDNGQAVEG